jgi:hypothetical protein
MVRSASGLSEVKGRRPARPTVEAMLTLEDCLALCELTEDEVLAIACHERVPELAAAGIGHYLTRTPGGELRIKAMIREDLVAAAAAGDRARALALKMILRDYILRHPDCEARHRQTLVRQDRRAPA